MVLSAQCLPFTRTSNTASWEFPRVSRWPAVLYYFLTAGVSTYMVLTMIKTSNHAKPSNVLISKISLCEKQEIAHQKEMFNRFGADGHTLPSARDISQVWTQGHMRCLGLTIQKKHREHCPVSCNGMVHDSGLRSSMLESFLHMDNAPSTIRKRKQTFKYSSNLKDQERWLRV